MYISSVILSVFNVENYITNAFNSILNQKIGFENSEVISRDDCSLGNSAKIINRFSTEHILIKLENLFNNV